MSADILQEQLQYYRDRAPEYDEWFLRRGRYNRGEKHRQQWFAEIAEVESALHSATPCGDILELACGTGLWTRHLVTFANNLVAIDGAPEAIVINRQRLGNLPIEYIVADDNLDNKGYSERKLNDGRTYRVVKIFYQPLELERSLIALDWRGKVDRTEKYFLHGLFARK